MGGKGRVFRLFHRGKMCYNTGIRDKGGSQMAETKQYSYYAFISYSRKDEKWAKWLQTQLETYRLPAAVRKSHVDVPRRISPVFRDKTDLASGRLEEVLQQELDDSKYLIVICSPNSAASPWVNKEVSRFIQTGREEQIIPFIVEGVPGGEPECFPPALKNDVQKEILGIDATEVGRVPAFLRVAAAMLGLKYDELYRRHRRRVLRRRITGALCGAAVLAVAGAVGWYLTPHSAYYANYVTRYEIPEGIHKLSDEEREGLSECYCIVRQRGRVTLLKRVNAAGQPVDPVLQNVGDEYPVTEFIYSDGGRLARAVLKDDEGVMVLQKSFSYNLEQNQIAIDFQQPLDSLQAFTLQGNTVVSYAAAEDESVTAPRHSDIARLLNTYDENGYLVQSRYQRDNRNNPACDANGVYGIRYERSEQGQTLRAVYLDENGQPHASRYGVVEERFEYDENGRCVKSSTYDADDQMVRSKDGQAQIQVEYTQQGNPTAVRYLDSEGEPCVTQDGYATVELTYDEKGMLVSQRHYGVDGAPAYEGEFGVHEARYAYDAKGYRVTESFFDGEGEPMYCTQGYAKSQSTYDDQGRQIRLMLFDPEGKPAPALYGACGCDVTYDENGYLQSITALDENGNAVQSDLGYVSTFYVNDDRGNPVRSEYRDENGQLMGAEGGVAVYVYEFDGTGNQTSVSFYNSEEQPCDGGNGYARREQVYENGNCVSTKYFGPEGEPVSPAGYHEERLEYDDRGNMISESYYDEQGQLASDGVARIEYEVDSYGNHLERRLYDAAGEPYQTESGPNSCWKYQWEYDQKGNEVRRKLYSLTGEYERGYAELRWEYNEQNQLTVETYYDENGEPCESADGASKLCNYYDEMNRLVLQEYYDLEGKKGNNYRITSVERFYDERSRPIRDVYNGYTSAAKIIPLVQMTYTYDAYGNMSTEYSVPEVDDPVMCVLSVAGPAAQAGIEPGDIIMRWNNWRYVNFEDAEQAMDEFDEAYRLTEPAGIIPAIPVVTAREKEDGSFEIFYNEFDSNVIGVYLQEKQMNISKIMDACTAYGMFEQQALNKFLEGIQLP